MNIAAFALAFAALAVAPAAAQDYVIDQQCSPEIYGAYSIRLGAAIGQEFIPTLAVMNVAEVLVVNGTTSNSAPADLFAVVHADSIAGPILGTSATTLVDDPFSGIVRLVFPVPVVLTPGALHVLEIRSMETIGNPMMRMGDQEGACPGVSGVFLGQRFYGGGDFWYRTGADAGLPARPASWGALKSLYR